VNGEIQPVNIIRKLLFIALTTVPLWAQGQNMTLSARIFDRESGEPLAFASVGIKGQPVGTITNEEGEVDFHFPISMRNDSLVVSMLGYQNFEGPIRPLLDNPTNIIFLEKSSIVLEEIVVNDTLTGGDILQIALSRIDQNFPMQPFLVEAFYRDVKKVGGTYISLLEAAVKIYDESYETPKSSTRLRERVKLVEVRTSLGYENKFTSYFDQDNLLEDLLLHNNIRYRTIDQSDDMAATMKREKSSFYNGHPIYVISANHEYRLKLFVDQTDFSVVHLEFETAMPSIDLTKRKSMSSKFVGLKKSIDFRRVNGKMYPSFITLTSRVNWFDEKTGALKFETELFQQLLVTRVTTNTRERIPSTERMRNYGLQYQDLPYNKEFWKNYNVIKQTPLDKKIMSDLEKSGSLQSQFEGNE